MEIKRLNNKNEALICQIEKLEKECFPHPYTLSQITVDVENENAGIFVAVADGTLLGYVGLHFVLDEGYMDNLAVFSASRKNGVATALLSALDDFAKEKKLSFITLEVRKSNLKAIKLYEKCGYKNVGTRKNFYRTPTEDAILMTKYY